MTDAITTRPDIGRCRRPSPDALDDDERTTSAMLPLTHAHRNRVVTRPRRDMTRDQGCWTPSWLSEPDIGGLDHILRQRWKSLNFQTPRGRSKGHEPLASVEEKGK